MAGRASLQRKIAREAPEWQIFRLTMRLRDLRFRQVNAMNTGDTETFAKQFPGRGDLGVRGQLQPRRTRSHTREGRWLAEDLPMASARLITTRPCCLLPRPRPAPEPISVEYGLRVGGAAQFVFGVYDEVCVWDGGAWRYARRTCYPLYLGPPDLSAPIRQFPAPPA